MSELEHFYHPLLTFNSINDVIHDNADINLKDPNHKQKICNHIASDEPRNVIEDMIDVALSVKDEKEEEKADSKNDEPIKPINNKEKWTTYDDVSVSSKKQLNPLQEFAIDITHSSVEKFKIALRERLSDKHNNPYSLNELTAQCSNDKCCSVSDKESKGLKKWNPLNHRCCRKRDQLLEDCLPLQRIEIVLALYHHLVQNKYSTHLVSHFLEKINYSHQQLSDDFLHVRLIHIDADNDAFRRGDGYYHIAMYLCRFFQKSYRCDLKKCEAFGRHHRDRSKDAPNPYGDQEVEQAAFQQQCDKIHSYFLQFCYQHIPSNLSVCVSF